MALIQRPARSEMLLSPGILRIPCPGWERHVAMAIEYGLYWLSRISSILPSKPEGVTIRSTEWKTGNVYGQLRPSSRVCDLVGEAIDTPVPRPGKGQIYITVISSRSDPGGVRCWVAVASDPRSEGHRAKRALDHSKPLLRGEVTPTGLSVRMTGVGTHPFSGCSNDQVNRAIVVDINQGDFSRFTGHDDSTFRGADGLELPLIIHHQD